MGERDTAEREIEHARERLSEIADEVSRRVSPERIKAEVRERGTEMALRAKEAALRRTTEVKDRAMSSPTALGLLGGVIGASLGAALARRTRGHQQSWQGRRLREGDFEEGYLSRRRVAHAGYGNVRVEPYGSEDVGYGSYEGDAYGPVASASPDARGEWTRESQSSGVGEEAGAREKLTEKGRELKDRARSAVQHASDRMKERVPSRGELRERADSLKSRAGDMTHSMRERAMDAGSRARSKLDEQPGVIALGAIALGALAAFLIPVTDRERRVFRPVQEKAKEALSSAGAKLEGSLRGEAPSGEQSSSSYEGSAPASGAYGAGSTAGEFSGTSANADQTRPLEERKPEQRLGDVTQDSDLPSVH